MKNIFDILAPDERVLAVFTTHDEWADNLRINEDGTGHTGDWALRANPDVDTLVIYHRQGNSNYIYKAFINRIEGPLPEYKKTRRYRIYFSRCQYKGITHSKWSSFVQCGANPVRYITV